MWSFAALCDGFFVSTRLRFKLDLSPSRETLLHFFEQIRRQHPELTRLRRRDDGGVILDEQPREGYERRFIRLDPDMLKIGVCGAQGPAGISALADMVLDLAPCHLSLSDLDYDDMEMVFGFDLEYKGNHDELIADTLFDGHPFMHALAGETGRVIDFQPMVGVSLTDDCDLQAYLDVKSRTSAYELRCNEYDGAALSVFLTLRRYWGFQQPRDLHTLHADLLNTGARLAADAVVPNIVQPLATAIAGKR